MLENQIAAWQTCYLAISAAGATLAGLLFVALSLHASTLKDPRNGNIRRLAEHTFRDFIRCLMVSLFLLIPNFAPAPLATVVIMIGLFGGLWVGKTLFDTARDKSAVQHGRYLTQRVVLSLLGDAFFVYAGTVILLRQNNDDIGLMLFAGLIVLLITSTRNAWFILIHELS